jgi:hypothetical protein
MDGAKKTIVQRKIKILPDLSHYSVFLGDREGWRKFVINISAAKIRALGFFIICVVLSIRIATIPSFNNGGMLSNSRTLDVLLVGLLCSLFSELRSAMRGGHSRREK